MFRQIVIVLSLLLAVPYCASAAETQCDGRLVGVKPVYADGQKVAELQMYWSAAKGKNCARLMHAGPSWGVARLTGVGVGICRDRNDRVCNRYNEPGSDTQYGRSYRADISEDYRFQAGPVETDRSNVGKCMRAAGYIRWNGALREVAMYGFCD